MTQSLQIGPLAIPWPLLLVFVTVSLALYLGRRAGKKLGLDVEPVLFRAAVAAVIAARLGFVWQYRDAYLSAPLGMLDIRDGGWSAEAGLIVGWLYALSASRVRTELRKPVLSAMAALREMPLLQQAQRDHPGVNFVFLNQGESAERVNQYLARHGLALRNVLLDPKGEMGAKFGQNAFPTTYTGFRAGAACAIERTGRLHGSTADERAHLGPARASDVAGRRPGQGASHGVCVHRSELPLLQQVLVRCPAVGRQRQGAIAARDRRHPDADEPWQGGGAPRRQEPGTGARCLRTWPCRRDPQGHGLGAPSPARRRRPATPSKVGAAAGEQRLDCWRGKAHGPGTETIRVALLA